MISVKCAQCGTERRMYVGHVNRAQKNGNRLFCSRECSGVARRKFKSDEQKKAEKKAYDAEYRVRDVEGRKAKKADYYQRTKDREKEARIRKERMPKHVEYCRRPEYVAWKREYDRQYRAKADYGEYWEAFILALDIRRECLSQMTDTEIRMQNGTFGKSQKRKRDYERTLSKEFEVGPLGSLELGQRR